MENYICLYFISYNSTFTKYSAAESNNPQEVPMDGLAMQQNINNGTEGERNSERTVDFTKTFNLADGLTLLPVRSPGASH